MGWARYTRVRAGVFLFNSRPDGVAVASCVTSGAHHPVHLGGSSPGQPLDRSAPLIKIYLVKLRLARAQSPGLVMKIIPLGRR